VSFLADQLVDLVVQIPEAVLAEARVLDLHHLLADLAQNLLAPLVRGVQIATLRREVRPPLLVPAAQSLLLVRDELVEHVLRGT